MVIESLIYLFIYFNISKNAGLFQLMFGSNMGDPNCWVSKWIKTFKPMVGFVHICRQIEFLFINLLKRLERKVNQLE